MPFNIEINSGGSIFSGGGVISATGANAGASMWITSGASLTLGTTISADANAAYSTFIDQKRNAMISGGTVTLNGVSQIFSSAYVGISSSCLMTLQNIRPVDGNINIVPTYGFWAEPGTPTTSGGVTILRTLPPCITCGDYNNLFAFEMVLYHAINKVAWDLMVMVDANDRYPEGTWARYEGLVAAWNFYAYKSQYVCNLSAVRDSLDITVGWVNPTCDTTGFTCMSSIARTVTSTPADLVQYLIFYTGTLMTADKTSDANTYTWPGPIGFIYKANSGGVNQVFCGAAPKSSLISALDIVANSSGSTVYGTYLDPDIGSSYSPYNDIVSATAITDVQDFAEDEGDLWIVGVVNPNVNGNDYAVQQFSLGIPSELTDSNYGGVTADALDTYRIRTRWWTRANNGVITGPTVTDRVQTLKTYALRNRS